MLTVQYQSNKSRQPRRELRQWDRQVHKPPPSVLAEREMSEPRNAAISVAPATDYPSSLLISTTLLRHSAISFALEATHS